MTDQLTAMTIGQGIEHNGVEFEMDQAYSVKLSDLFRQTPYADTLEFNATDDVLNLKCLERTGETGSYLIAFSCAGTCKQPCATGLRTKTPPLSRNWQVRVFILAAIAAAFTGDHRVVLYVTKVNDILENSTSLFWMTKPNDFAVYTVAWRRIATMWTVHSAVAENRKASPLVRIEMQGINQFPDSTF